MADETRYHKRSDEAIHALVAKVVEYYWIMGLMGYFPEPRYRDGAEATRFVPARVTRTAQSRFASHVRG